MKDSHLKAVHDDDLESLLSSLGYFERVSHGECQCAFCGTVITLENLGAIVPQNGEIVFSCDSTGCLQRMIEAGEGSDFE